MLENKLHLFTLVIFLALFFLAYLVPIADIDFWWHIATGRYILESGSIPSVDPFLVFDDSNPIRNRGILKGYWLGQIILYSVYHYLSDMGLMAFRALILVTCLVFLYLRMRILNVSGLSVWLSLLVAALVLQGFTGERPTLFSFLFMVLLLLLWDGFKVRENRLWLIPVPIIFVLWPNFHGGYLLGIVVMGILVGVNALAALKTKGWPRQWLGCGAFFILLFVASLINPVGFDHYFGMFQMEGGELQNRTSEYISVLAIYRYGLWFEQFKAVLFLVLAVGAIYWTYKKQSWDKLLVMTFLMIITISAYRYLVFFVIVATPYIAQSLMSLENRFTGSIVAYNRLLDWCALIFVSVCLVLYLSFYQPAQSKDRFADLNEGLELIKQHQGAGYAFNTMNIGGYLIWRLGPDMHTFIDGRMIDDKKLVPYTHILWTTDEGKKWFDQARFDWVIMTTKNQFTGEHYSLVDYLRTQREWRVFFQTEDWIIFEKN
jgi:hypothetical protein